MFEKVKTTVRMVCLAAAMMALLAVPAYADQSTTEEDSNPHIIYQADLVYGDWTDERSDGQECGQSGPSGGIEALQIRLKNIGGGITYRVYLSSGGWQGWKADGEVAGKPGEGNTVEAIEVKLTGEAAKVLNLYYSVTVDKEGDLDWATNGQSAGSVGKGLDLQKIRLVLNGKNEPAPGAMDRAVISNQPLGWYQDESGLWCYRATPGLDYTGWIDREGVRYYMVESRPIEAGWHYIDGLKFYFEQGGVLVQELDSIIGKQSEYQINVNKLLNCVTIYAKDGDNGFIIPIKSMLCSVGDDTPLGVFHTPEKYRWRLMVNGTYTQYATRLTAGQGFLFHSVTYDKPDIYSLIAYGYNGLGVVRSLGCIRLTAENAKWVYDNCKIGTTVYIYEDANSVGPFFRPEADQIPEDQKWDPTDPLVKADIVAGKGPAAAQVRAAQQQEESVNQVTQLDPTQI